jgi:hypothetical protein
MIDGDDLGAAIHNVGINNAMEPWKTRLTGGKNTNAECLWQVMEPQRCLAPGSGADAITHVNKHLDHIAGNGIISRISTHAPGICRCG